jgi:hypothetical protein
VLLFLFFFTADLVAVQRLLRQDEEANTPQEDGTASGDEASEGESNEAEDTAEGPTYDDLLELGRHIGDVKQERWKFK